MVHQEGMLLDGKEIRKTYGFLDDTRTSEIGCIQAEHFNRGAIIF